MFIPFYEAAYAQHHQAQLNMTCQVPLKIYKTNNTRLKLRWMKPHTSA